MSHYISFYTNLPFQMVFAHFFTPRSFTHAHTVSPIQNILLFPPSKTSSSYKTLKDEQPLSCMFFFSSIFPALSDGNLPLNIPVRFSAHFIHTVASKSSHFCTIFNTQQIFPWFLWVLLSSKADISFTLEQNPF